MFDEQWMKKTWLVNFPKSTQVHLDEVAFACNDKKIKQSLSFMSTPMQAQVVHFSLELGQSFT